MSIVGATRAHCSSVWISVRTGKAVFLLQIGEDFHRLFKPDAALAGNRRAVGLVEGGFVDEADAERLAEFDHRAGDHEGMIAAFHLAGSGDQRQFLGVGKHHLAGAAAGHHICICLHDYSPNAKMTPCPGASGTIRRLSFLVKDTALAVRRCSVADKIGNLEDDGAAAQTAGMPRRFAVEETGHAGLVENGNLDAVARLDVHAEGMRRDFALVDRFLEDVLEIGGVRLGQHDFADADDTVSMVFQRRRGRTEAASCADM